MTKNDVLNSFYILVKNDPTRSLQIHPIILNTISILKSLNLKKMEKTIVSTKNKFWEYTCNVTNKPTY